MSSFSFLPSSVGQPLPRRSFLQYGGASAALGSLWLAGCAKKEEPTPTPAALPTIASFSPGSGAPGAAITVTGTNLTGTTTVTVGGAAASFTVVNATTLTLLVPTTGQTGAIVVTTTAGTATSSTSLTVLPAQPVVAITGISPASAAPGNAVTLTGTNFTGATALSIGNTPVPGFVVVNATTITFVVPVAASTGPISVTAPVGTATSGMPFTVLPPTLVNVGSGDLGVLNFAYALEQLEAAFYTQLRTGTYYTGLTAGSAEKQVLDDLYYHEVIHREFFQLALGANAIRVLMPNFSTINFNDRTSVLGAAKSFEDLGVAAYNGAAQFITSPGYLFLAGKIVSVEARHAALIRDLIAENTFVGNDVVTLTSASTSSVPTNNAPAGSSLERAKSPAEVAVIANLFLAAGSQLDASGLV